MITPLDDETCGGPAQLVHGGSIPAAAPVTVQSRALRPRCGFDSLSERVTEVPPPSIISAATIRNLGFSHGQQAGKPMTDSGSTNHCWHTPLAHTERLSGSCRVVASYLLEPR